MAFPLRTAISRACRHIDLLLGVKMTVGMRRNAHPLYSLPVPLDDMLDCRVCQLSAVKGKKVIILCVFQREILRCTLFIPQHGFPQNRCNRNDSLFVVFAVNDNKIAMNVLPSDTAQPPAANSRFKQHGQNSCITYLHKIAAFTGLQHTTHIGN